MADPAQIILASDLDGTNGARFDGPFTNARVGVQAGSAGDLNGDGFEDFIIGAYYDNALGGDYVVFGKPGGLPAHFGASYFTDGTNGFRITGVVANSLTGRAFASLGDINGDGIDDLIVAGAQTANGNAYVLYGSHSFAANVSLADLNGANGFRINGYFQNDQLSRAVQGLTDFNGDGYRDILISAPGADQPERTAGAVYVLFGSAQPFPLDFNIGDVNGVNGIRINGFRDGQVVGESIVDLGDINGDDLSDIAISSRIGSTYVVFGQAGGALHNFSLADLDGINGFAVVSGNVDRIGYSFAAAGDVNGDGFDDFILSAENNPGEDFVYNYYTDEYEMVETPGSGVAHIIFGHAGGFGATVDVLGLNAAEGVHIRSDTLRGGGVAGLGDVNGDGIDDIALSYIFADSYGGRVYVIYGRTGGTGDIDLDNLTSDQGFIVQGNPNDFIGLGVSHADINGDGSEDLLISGYGGPGGQKSGNTLIVYGQQGPVNFAGTGINDTVNGRATNDTIRGNGGNDTLYGLDGDDILDGGDLSDLLYGGQGADDLIGGAGGDILYGDEGADELDGGDGNDKLFGGTGADLLNGGTGNDRLDGEANIDTLRGGAGNDTLDGGLGADLMYGGSDNDVYIVDDPNDQTIELPGEGSDIVRTTLSWTLSANIETLQLQGSTDASGTGTADANNLQGNAGNNILSGLAGVDTINGADGDDIIIGGVGNDLLRGGLGADIFKVSHAFGSVLETDQIYDFSTAEGDRMNFQDVFVGTIQKVAAFNHTAGQMTLTFAAGITTVRLDIDGNNTPDYQVKINGDVTGDWAGWLL